MGEDCCGIRVLVFSTAVNEEVDNWVGGMRKLRFTFGQSFRRVYRNPHFRDGADNA